MGKGAAAELGDCSRRLLDSLREGESRLSR